MSLGIIIKAPEGLVLAAESRVTFTTAAAPNIPALNVTYDNATKLFSFHAPYDKIGVVTYGQAAIGLRTAQSFIPEFESSLKKVSTTKRIEDFAQAMSNFFMEQWKKVMPEPYVGQDMTFNVAGFDDDEPYGRVYSFLIPRAPKPVEQNPMLANGQPSFGITWGGQREIVDRLIFGYDARMFSILAMQLKLDAPKIEELKKQLMPLTLQLPIQVMPLQDCVDVALLFLRTTIDAQKLAVQIRGCGGAIDLAIITRDNKLKFIQQKEITGERNLTN